MVVVGNADHKTFIISRLESVSGKSWDGIFNIFKTTPPN